MRVRHDDKVSYQGICDLFFLFSVALMTSKWCISSKLHIDSRGYKRLLCEFRSRSRISPLEVSLTTPRCWLTRWRELCQVEFPRKSLCSPPIDHETLIWYRRSVADDRPLRALSVGSILWASPKKIKYETSWELIVVVVIVTQTSTSGGSPSKASRASSMSWMPAKKTRIQLPPLSLNVVCNNC